MHKLLDLNNLYKDLGYIIHGNFIQEFLFKQFPPKEDMGVLEAGCGSGKLGIAYAAARGCRQVLALDIDRNCTIYAGMLLKAYEALTLLELSYAYLAMEGTVFNMDKIPDNYYDLVFNEGVPQHFPEDVKRQAAINEMVRVSKKWVCIIGNNGDNPEEQKEDQTVKFTYEGMPPTRRCFTAVELMDKLAAAGLVDICIVYLPGGRITPSLDAEFAHYIAGWGRKVIS